MWKERKGKINFMAKEKKWGALSSFGYDKKMSQDSFNKTSSVGYEKIPLSIIRIYHIMNWQFFHEKEFFELLLHLALWASWGASSWVRMNAEISSSTIPPMINLFLNMLSICWRFHRCKLALNREINFTVKKCDEKICKLIFFPPLHRILLIS